MQKPKHREEKNKEISLEQISSGHTHYLNKGTGSFKSFDLERKATEAGAKAGDEIR